MAIRQKIYLLTGTHSDTAILIDPNVSDAEVWDEWELALKRAEARKTLDPDMYSDRDRVDATAVDELQTKHPDWQIFYGGRIVHIRTAKLIYRPKK